MPGFVVHTTANTLVLVGASALLSNIGWAPQDIIALDAGILISTLILSPDMDLFTSRPMEDWGLLRVFWWPYARLVKHRDRLHTPILGTTVRWSYLLILFLVALLALRFALEWAGVRVSLSFVDPNRTILHYARFMAEMFIGGNIADAVHFVLDFYTHGLEHGRPRHYGHSQQAARRYPRRL